MKTLPKRLQNAISTVSTTIQELIFEVALHASGHPAEPGRSSASVHADRKDNEDAVVGRNERLLAYVEEQARDPHPKYPLSPFDYAYVVCALAGNSSRSIAEFLRLEHTPVKKRLDAIANRVKADVCFSGETSTWRHPGRVTKSVPRAGLIPLQSRAGRTSSAFVPRTTPVKTALHDERR